jgi:hypothetical protein
MTAKLAAMHGLAIKKFGTPAAIAAVLGADDAEIAKALGEAVAAGEVIAARGAFMLTPAGQAALAADYRGRFADLRGNAAFVAAYGRFEALNSELKQLMTDWQTLEVAGETLPNDHSNKEHDDRAIDRLGDLQERAEAVLSAMAAALPRLARYRHRLDAALAKAEEGAIEFVSGAKIDSYHTVWFELHEDLLRLLGRKRNE